MENPREIKTSTIKALFAKSGNRCAFPKCKSVLVENDDLVVCEICHIYGVLPKSARYDPSKSNEYLRSKENLILLCHAHHRRIDSEEHAYKYAPATLKMWRENHESSLKENFEVIDQVVSDVKTNFERDNLANTFFSYPQLRLVAEALAVWNWDDKDIAQEQLLDCAAKLCYSMSGGRGKAFRMSGAYIPTPASAEVLFETWVYETKRICGKGTTNLPLGDSEHWLKNYSKVILRIANELGRSNRH